MAAAFKLSLACAEERWERRGERGVGWANDKKEGANCKDSKGRDEEGVRGRREERTERRKKARREERGKKNKEKQNN
jgi:hypothetical protein